MLMLCASFIFFFNPNVIVIDILPDFIGYMLLCGALLKLSDFNDTVGEAVGGFKKMILVDGAKWLAVMWIFGISSPDERTSSMLLWSFVFCVLETVGNHCYQHGSGALPLLIVRAESHVIFIGEDFTAAFPQKSAGIVKSQDDSIQGS